MKERRVGIEYLRIISMLCIVGNHFLLFTKALNNVVPFTANYYLVWLLEAMGYVGVDCFVLISGYFLIQSKFSLKKIVALIGEVLFYSIIILVVLSLLKINAYSYVDVLKSMMPISTRQYWFITDYIALYLLSPFLNCGLINLGRKKYQCLICCLILLFSIWDIFPGEQLGAQHGYSLYWLIVLYCIGAYIRIYGGGVLKSKKGMTFLYVICIILMWSSKIMIALIEKKIPKLDVYSTIFYCHSSIFVLGAAIALFMIFKDVNTQKYRLKKIVLKVSASTFGVYLIHMNINLANVYWKKITSYIDVNKLSLFIWYIIVTLMIYTLCTIIDMARGVIVNQIKIRGKKL